MGRNTMLETRSGTNKLLTVKSLLIGIVTELKLNRIDLDID